MEALRIIGGRVPDLIISDIMMPQMNGFKLLKEQGNNFEPSGYIFSARAENGATIEDLEAGADDYLVKLFSGKELLEPKKTLYI